MENKNKSYEMAEFKLLSHLIAFIEQGGEVYTYGCDYCKVAGVMDAIRRFLLKQTLYITDNRKAGEITGFSCEDVRISLSRGEAHIRQDNDWIVTTGENMNDICIQYLALNNPSVLNEGSDSN